MLPVEENVFQPVSWNCANPNNSETHNRNIYFKSLKRIGKIFKIKNTQSERNKSSRSCITKPAWEGGIVKELSNKEKSRDQPHKRNTTINIIRRTEQVKICTERHFKSCNLTVLRPSLVVYCLSSVLIRSYSWLGIVSIAYSGVECRL